MVNQPGSEIEYLKSQFGNGLYASLHISRFAGVDINWHQNIQNVNIQGFKDIIDSLVEKAKLYNVGIHIGLNVGLARSKYFYQLAKEEDIRNAQWYNDNNLASQKQLSQTSQANDLEQTHFFDLNMADESTVTHSRVQSNIDSALINKYVWGTFSRYARKLRTHLAAKMKAAFAYLKQKQEKNPDVLIIVSAPGEAELNYRRLNNAAPLQDFFCDYSPFAVLEFRDWIKHEGMYGPGGKYEGEGYVNGGTRYRGANGLQRFNQDFETTFTTWDLKYYNWGLSDPVDSDYTDNVNPDPNIIPIDDYTFDGMMPTSGVNFINGGFDPPRVMRQDGEDSFWDLWQTFRQTMVYHYVKDITKIAVDAGFPPDQYYTHQIPGDYLFGTRPHDPQIPFLNPRFYSSASPLWTAKNDYGTGMGVTMYDINFGTYYAATSKYILPDLSAVTDNWCAVEYNPEIIITGDANDINRIQYIYEQMKRLYDYNAHTVCFFKWEDEITYQYKGNNRELAAKQFFDVVKDKARQPITTVFTPRIVKRFAGQYMDTTDSVELTWSEKIWSDLDYLWANWGDFKEFVIYRGYTEDFPCNSSSEIARLTGYSYIDRSFFKVGTVYYKIKAVNTDGEEGTYSIISVSIPNQGTATSVLSISRNSLNFGASVGGPTTPAQVFTIENTGSGALVWNVDTDVDWITCSPSNGVNDNPVNVTVDASGKTAGTYNGTITVSAVNAFGSPRTVNVTLRVTASGQDAAPLGKWETPANGSTVRSSIPVTGWVLDDIAVESIKIYRQKQNGLDHIGDAVLIEGARPDVETAYPSYPCNYKAGWGYMLLTNFLPNQGNGTFTFHVIARDVTGHEKTLGTRTLTCDNANAVKPFGAIDTPRQGGTVSGSSYVNFGWVLTPQPNMIPTDGSTINVWIDGVNVGHPVYNNYRADIAALFPNYANSNGAVGYYFLDTTKYENGVHTIQWVAADDAGNTDGIGSRYFNIQNTDGVSDYRSQSASVLSVKCSVLSEISEIPSDYSQPVRFRKGYNKHIKSHIMYPNDKGTITIELKELERLDLQLHDPNFKKDLKSFTSLHFTPNTKHLTLKNALSRQYTGFLAVGNALRPLPIGSTLDSERGVFSWLPGPGFIGEYRLVFIARDKSGKFTKKNVIVKIVPKFSS
ncbi:MAG: hypothetical protein GTO56_05555 [Candidatus Aminicenantes bacterium]|nr:hypothetical protein [Candidatus Aminicenantes bacterium]